MGEAEVTGRILDRDLPAQRVLQPPDVTDHDFERFFCIGQRQQVIEITPAARAPGQVIGHKGGLEALHQRGHAREMRRIEPVRRAQRQADGVD